MACSGHQFSLCRWFTYRTIILPTADGWEWECGGGVEMSWGWGMKKEKKEKEKMYNNYNISHLPSPYSCCWSESQGQNLESWCQGMSKTRSILDVWVPVELWWIYEGPFKGNVSLLNAWVENVIMYRLKYVHEGDFTWVENEKKAVFSFYSSLTIYNGWVTQRKELIKKKGSYLLLPMKKDQTNWTRVYKQYPLAL